MEWGHRNWGRGMGVLFMVPLIGFLMTKKMAPVVKKRTLGLMGLLCFQGGMGWYMVKSGLVQPEKIGYKVIFLYFLTFLDITRTVSEGIHDSILKKRHIGILI